MVKISKKYDRDFTVIQNSFFKFNDRLPKEEKLGFKEAGIFWYLWHLPNDWEFHESEIINHFKDKIDSFRTGRQKLEKYGFIKKVRNRNKQGQVGAYEWTLDDDPEFPPGLDFPKQEKPTLEKPTQENPHVQNTNSTKDESNKVFNNNNTSSEDSILNNPYTAFESQICKLNAYQRVEFLDWQKEFGNDVLLFAIKHICTTDLRTTWGTFNWLMKTWHDHNLKSLSDVKDYEKQNYEANKAKRSYKSSKHKKKVESYGQGEYAVEKAKADRGEFPF